MPKIGSKERIRRFLREHVGEVVTGQQLQEVVGTDVTEWARRVRELRSDEGWRILTQNDDAKLKTGEYLLVTEPPELSTYQFAKPKGAKNIAQEPPRAC